MKTKLALILIIMAGSMACNGPDKKNPVSNPEKELPRVMTTYRKLKSFDEDFEDLKAHGVEAVDIGDNYMDDPKVLEAARKYDIKLMSRLEIPLVDDENPNLESGIMMAGNYNGKAIDRFTFSFDPKPYTIILEAPIYHKDNIYDGGKTGHYFPGVNHPEKVELIIADKIFDGEQHIKIVPAKFERIDAHFWQVSFDLTHVQGDLDNVVIAAYWITDKRERRGRNDVAAYASSTIDAVKNIVRGHIAQWKKTNGGVYPEEIIALRLGDEEWNRAAHSNSTRAASYPIWDFSQSAVDHFENEYPGIIYPRGKHFTKIFGRQTYADWMYEFHKGKAQLVRTIKETLGEEGLGHLKLYRNTTRGNVYSVKNDHDGSGLELLAKEFDIVHIDPYPVRKNNYTDDILIDMAYVSGFARRFDKPLVPWLQAHQYYPDGYFGLVHPNPLEMEHMFREHLKYAPDGIMWLGYGKGDFYTFPQMRPDSWKKVGELHQKFRSFPTLKKTAAKLAVVRPYNVRALRGMDGAFPQDRFFTETLLRYLIIDQEVSFDPFEPRSLSDLSIEEIRQYPLLFTELGILGTANLQPLVESDVQCVVFMEGCDKIKFATAYTGIQRFEKNLANVEQKIKFATTGKEVTVISSDIYRLDDSVNILATLDGHPIIWKKKNLIFVAVRGEIGDFDFIDKIWQLVKD